MSRRVAPILEIAEKVQARALELASSANDADLHINRPGVYRYPEPTPLGVHWGLSTGSAGAIDYLRAAEADIARDWDIQ